MSQSAVVRSVSKSNKSPAMQEAVPAHDGRSFSHPHANILGVQVSALDLESAVDLADHWLRSQAGQAYICVTGVHGVMEAHADPDLRQILNSAFMNVPDGMPMTWIGRWQGHKRMDRVFGPDFMAAMCEISVDRKYRHFLCGGEPGVAEQLKETLERRFPGLNVVGTWTPPFRNLWPVEEAELCALLRASQPHIVWLGMSTPKQERFMAQYVNRLRVPLLVGVGAAFDFHTGRIRDCSTWIKRCGLQWLHRLAQEPRRLWRRYLLNNPAFVWNIACQLVGLRQYPNSHKTLSPIHSILRSSTPDAAVRSVKSEN